MRVILSRFLLLILSMLIAACFLADHLSGSIKQIPLSVLLGGMLFLGFLIGSCFRLLKTVPKKTQHRGSHAYQQIIRTEQEIVDWLITYTPQRKPSSNKRK